MINKNDRGFKKLMPGGNSILIQQDYVNDIYR